MSPYSAARSAARARVLMVDDNSLGLSARKSMLEELGHSVSSVSSAEDAMAQLSDASFDLIVTDYKLPGITGGDMIAKLRAQGVATPIILLSGYVDALGLDEQSTGADVVLQKSANEANHLVRSVKNLLRRGAIVRKPMGADKPSASKLRKKA